MTANYIPNSFQTPNVLADEIMPLLTPQEWLVLSFATRHILGWHDRIHERRAPISLSRFEKCGLSREAILTALVALERYGLLHKIGSATQQGQVWELSFDAGVDLDGLKQRKQHKRTSAASRTRTARSVALTRQSDRLPGGQSHRPASSQSDRPGGGQSDRRNQTQYQTQDQTQNPSASSDAADDGGVQSRLFVEHTQIGAKQVKRTKQHTVEAVSVPPTPGSAPPPPAPQPHIALIEAYLTALPAQPIQKGNPYARYGAIASALVKESITPQQVAEYVHENSREPLWVGKCIPLEYVARNIRVWLKTRGAGKDEQQISLRSSDSNHNGAGYKTSDSSAAPKPRPLPACVKR